MRKLRKLHRIVCIGVLVLTGSSAGSAADDVNQRGITSSQADAILSELRLIRQLLEQQARPALPLPPQKRSLKIEGGNSLGPVDAPLTMVEFTDYQCPFCRQFDQKTFTELRKQYIETGKLRFVSRNLPLDIHSDAMGAASAAMCAGDQGQYWPMREILFAPEASLAPTAILEYAKRVPFDQEKFSACLASDKHKAAILQDIEDAGALQINGTPSFLIGKTTPYGVEGYVVAGALSFAQIEQRLKDIESGR